MNANGIINAALLFACISLFAGFVAKSMGKHAPAPLRFFKPWVYHVPAVIAGAAYIACVIYGICEALWGC